MKKIFGNELSASQFDLLLHQLTTVCVSVIIFWSWHASQGCCQAGFFGISETKQWLYRRRQYESFVYFYSTGWLSTDRRSHGGFPPILCRFVLWEAVSPTNYFCCLEVKVLGPHNVWAGLDTVSRLGYQLSSVWFVLWTRDVKCGVWVQYFSRIKWYPFSETGFVRLLSKRSRHKSLQFCLVEAVHLRSKRRMMGMKAFAVFANGSSPWLWQNRLEIELVSATGGCRAVLWTWSLFLWATNFCNSKASKLPCGDDLNCTVLFPFP